jgi:HSP20 family protein
MLMEHAADMARPDLFREMRRRQQEMNRFLDRLGFGLATFPPVKIWAGADGAIINAEIPGVGPDQLDITVYQDTVTLRGRRDPDEIEGEVVIHRQERQQGPFARTMVLPFRVDADKVAAHFNRGVLTLDLPRPAADKPRHIQVARG